MNVLPGEPNNLLITLIGDDKDRIFDILIDGQKLETVTWKGGQTGRFYDLEFPIPQTWLAGKSRVEVRIEANHGKTAGRIFEVKTLKGKQ
jgi:hypothetical protein